MKYFRDKSLQDLEVIANEPARNHIFTYVLENGLDEDFWQVRIRNLEDLNHYIRLQGHVKSAIRTIFLDQIEGGDFSNEHFADPMTRLAVTILHSAKARGEEMSLLDLDRRLNDEYFRSRFDVVANGRSILVNQAGGWHFDSGSYKDVAVRRGLVFPDIGVNSVHVSQWPGGSHYYAKIGKVDVCVGGDVKWESRAAALQAAETFLMESIVSIPDDPEAQMRPL